MIRIRLYTATPVLGLAAMLGTTSATPPAATTALAATALRAHDSSDAAHTPASQPAPPTCPAQYVCGYTGPNYTGKAGFLIGNNSDLTGPGSIWEQVDSIYNNGAVCEVWMYRWKNYVADGHVVGFRINTGFTNLETQAPGLYHHTWSNHWCSNI
jgi:hypothetical protein